MGTKLSLCLLLVILLPVFGNAQRPRFDVTFTVTADASVKDTATSYIARELRSLGDVDIVDKDGFDKLSFLIMTLDTVGGRQSGYVVSLATSWQSTCSIGGKTPHPCWVSDDHLVYVGADLRKLCEEAVTGFDRRTLEDVRKAKP